MFRAWYNKDVNESSHRYFCKKPALIGGFFVAPTIKKKSNPTRVDR